MAYFSLVQAGVLYVIYDCHSGSDGRNIENIELCLSETSPVYLPDRLYPSVAVTADKYCIFGRVHGAI